MIDTRCGSNYEFTQLTELTKVRSADDGSSYYDISFNVFYLNEGLKSDYHGHGKSACVSVCLCVCASVCLSVCLSVSEYGYNRHR